TLPPHRRYAVGAFTCCSRKQQHHHQRNTQTTHRPIPEGATMSDTAKSWIEERQAIHTKATPGEWWWEGESNEEWPQSENSLMAGGEPVVNGWGYDASGINVEDNDATYITDALNMFPRALTALEQ